MTAVYIVAGALLIAALILLFFLQKKFFRPDTSRAATLMDTYRVMTPELLAATPDDNVVSAVVSNILSHAEEEKTDPYHLLATLSQERCAVYTVWLFLRELEHDPAALRRKEQHVMTELAVDALRTLECDALADTLADFLKTGDDAAIGSMKTQLQQTDVPTMLVAWIRSDPLKFCDTMGD